MARRRVPTADDFRRIALGLQGVVEGAHMGHPDFRVHGKVFASLTADLLRGSMKLTPDAQAACMADHPQAFSRASGAWGRQGWTGVQLDAASIDAIGEALTLAWQTMPAKAPARAQNAPAKAVPAAGASAIDDYIGSESRAEVRGILERIRDIIRKEVPGGVEKLSYRMPAVFLDGAVLYYAPFAHHIGIYPPVKGDALLDKALAPYRGEKGNLRFPLDAPMPYPLIRRVVRARLAEHRLRRAAKRRTP
ncbi:MAG: MmcQ/YjbR family DNA-binding protein [Vicinamibacterales bacterium]